MTDVRSVVTAEYPGSARISDASGYSLGLIWLSSASQSSDHSLNQDSSVDLFKQVPRPSIALFSSGSAVSVIASQYESWKYCSNSAWSYPAGAEPAFGTGAV